jgi:hypothetical protein
MIFSTVLCLQSTVFSREKLDHTTFQDVNTGFHGEYSFKKYPFHFPDQLPYAPARYGKNNLLCSHSNSQQARPRSAFKNEEERQQYMSGHLLERNGGYRRSSKGSEGDAQESASTYLATFTELSMPSEIPASSSIHVWAWTWRNLLSQIPLTPRCKKRWDLEIVGNLRFQPTNSKRRMYSLTK